MLQDAGVPDDLYIYLNEINKQHLINEAVFKISLFYALVKETIASVKLLKKNCMPFPFRKSDF